MGSDQLHLVANSILLLWLTVPLVWMDITSSLLGGGVGGGNKTNKLQGMNDLCCILSVITRVLSRRHFMHKDAKALNSPQVISSGI